MAAVRVFFLIVAMYVSLTACSREQSAFEQVQICAEDERGVAELKNVMQAVAQAENLRFIDNSPSQTRDLGKVGADRDVSHAIDLHIEGEGGLGVTAGNLGLPTYQVGLGFTEGSDPAKARHLANHLISGLSQHWSVQRVPSSQGILPMRGCGG